MFEKWAETFKRKGAKVEDTELTFKEYNDEVIKEAPATEAPVYEEPKKQAPVTAGAGGDDSNIELKVVRPATFEEVGNIADYLLDGCTVFLDTENMDPDECMRMLDFLNGVTYTTEGYIKQVGKNNYAITPSDVDISEDE
jgi:FtsZ-interacting cell division protein YlmF